MKTSPRAVEYDTPAQTANSLAFSPGQAALLQDGFDRDTL